MKEEVDKRQAGWMVVLGWEYKGLGLFWYLA